MLTWGNVSLLPTPKQPHFLSWTCFFCPTPTSSKFNCCSPSCQRRQTLGLLCSSEPPRWKPEFINLSSQTMLVSLLLVVKPARSNLQDSLCMVSGHVLSCLPNISLIHPALVSGLSSCSSSPGHGPLPAAGLPRTLCHILPILCPSAALASLPSQAPLPHSPPPLPWLCSPGGPPVGSHTALIYPGPLLAGCPILPRCQALPLAVHLSLCIVISYLLLCLPTDHTPGAGLFFH